MHQQVQESNGSYVGILEKACWQEWEVRRVACDALTAENFTGVLRSRADEMIWLQGSVTCCAEKGWGTEPKDHGDGRQGLPERKEVRQYEGEAVASPQACGR